MALKTAVDLASRLGSELCLVHVVPAIPELPSVESLLHEGEYDQALHIDAEKQLAKMVKEIAHRGVTAKYVVGTANDTAMEILRITDHEHADLLVISTHGMTGWRQLALGSVAEKIVRLANIPVLFLRAQPEATVQAASPAANPVATH
jgi:nucleotide-binding universal stress UspA family protein